MSESLQEQKKKFQHEVYRMNPSNNYSKLYDRISKKFDMIFEHKCDGCEWHVCEECGGEFCDFHYEHFHLPKVCSIYKKIYA